MITEFSKYKVINDNWIIDNVGDLGIVVRMANDEKGCYVRFSTFEIPQNVFFTPFDHIAHFGTKDEMETILIANKYNI